ncbi:MAG: SH3 domain-containing protein [Candidatus Limnocylindria bacterium]
MGIRRLISTLLGCLLLAACTLPPLNTPTPVPTPSPTPTPTPSPTPSPTPTPTPDPTPDLGAVPRFQTREIVATAIDGLRVRQRPGVSSVVVTGLLPLSARLGVVMGPIVVDELGWYLVTDADPAEPQFEEGWIATGFEPEAFLRATGDSAEESPLVAGLAGTGDAEQGPIEIPDPDHAIRWIAIDPEGVRCSFGVTLAAGSADPIRAISATIGNSVVPGTLQPSYFASQPTLRGQLFMAVTSDCAWALVVTRSPPIAPDPSSSASESP